MKTIPARLINLYNYRIAANAVSKETIMKKTLLISIAALSIGAVAAFAAGTPVKDGKKAAAAKSDCGDCPMHKKAGAPKKCSGVMCPEKIAGVETVAKNIPGGIEITMTAKDSETIAKMQELALVHYGNKETMDKDCPGRVEGAEASIENTADGARGLITGKTPEVVKKIQAASAKEHKGAHAAREGKKEAKASNKYICPMNCPGSASDKPGNCPKCGMPLTEKK